MSNSDTSVKSFALQIILIVFSCLFGFLVSQYSLELDRSTVYVDYYQRKIENIFSNISGRGVTVKKSSEEFSEVSMIEFMFANNQSVDIDNFPVYIEFYIEKGKKIELVASSIIGSKGLSDGIENLKVEKKKDKLIVSFVINVLNRNQKWEDNPRATFLISGERLPSFEIKTIKSGCEVRSYLKENYLSFYGKHKEMIRSMASKTYLLFFTIFYLFTLINNNLKIRKLLRNRVKILEETMLTYDFNENSHVDPQRFFTDLYASCFCPRLALHKETVFEKYDKLASKDEKVIRDVAMNIAINDHKFYAKNRNFADRVIFPYFKKTYDIS